MRIIENTECLPMVRCNRGLGRIVATRFGSRPISNERWGKYYDLKLRDGSIAVGVHESEVVACKEEKQIFVMVAQGGWAYGE